MANPVRQLSGFASSLARPKSHALAVTGGVITSAGVVLAATFAVLTSFPLVVTLQLGLIVPIGILLDTFVVRTPACADAGRPRRSGDLVAQPRVA